MQRHLERVGIHHAHVGPVPQIVVREHRRRLVHLDCRDGEPQRGHGHRVGAQTGREIRDALHPGLHESRGMPRRHREPRRLLEPLLMKRHAGGELAELGPAVGPQARLGKRRCHQFWRRTFGPQSLPDGQRTLRVVLANSVGQGPARGGDGEASGGDVHVPIVSRLANAHALAL